MPESPPYILLVAALLFVVSVVLAVVRPATRRWLAAGTAMGVGLLAALYLVIAGALAAMDAPSSASLPLYGAAAAAAIGGIAVAVWIIRAGRPRPGPDHVDAP